MRGGLAGNWTGRSTPATQVQETPGSRSVQRRSQTAAGNGKAILGDITRKVCDVKYVLLTGATGLVGRYLVRDLLRDGHRLAVLVRSSRRESAAERIEGLLQFWEQQAGESLPRPVVLSGDVASDGCGLSDEDLVWARGHCDRIIHNAASLTFVGADRERDPWLTNLQGTRNTLLLAEQLGVEEFHYVSTAYVCGWRQGVVREDELDVGQTFRNDYEHSKFLSEQMVRESSFLRDLTIYRPTVIGGDSQTGFTSTYHGVYAYLKLMAVINGNAAVGEDGRRHTPVRLRVTGDEPRNVVPVDWVSEAISRIFRAPSLHGRTYHLAPRQPITARQVIEAGYEYFNSYGVEFAGTTQPASETIGSLDQAARDGMVLYETYETSDPVFDTANVDRYLPDLPCPPIDRASLLQCFRFGEQDRWGKRREPKPEVPCWIDERLEELLASDNEDDTTPEFSDSEVIGLCVSGAGGGQWSLEYAEGQLVGLERGLPDAPAIIFRTTAPEMIELLRGLPLLSRDVIVDLASSSSRSSTSPHVASPRVDSPRVDAMA